MEMSTSWIDPVQVTTTSNKSGKFEVRFFSQIYQHELGTVGGHFGPINSLAFNPDGKRSARLPVFLPVTSTATCHLVGWLQLL